MRWNFSVSMENNFWSIVDQSGRVIALRVTSENLASEICDMHNEQPKVEQELNSLRQINKDHIRALIMLDRRGVWTGADQLVSDRLVPVFAEIDQLRADVAPDALAAARREQMEADAMVAENEKIEHTDAWSDGFNDACDAIVVAIRFAYAAAQKGEK